MSQDMLTLIRLFWMRADKDRKLELPCDKFYTGSTALALGDASDFDLILSRRPGWYYVERWGNGYRSVWVNGLERAIFTYVEGDLDLTIDDNNVKFWERMERAEAFYKKY